MELQHENITITELPDLAAESSSSVLGNMLGVYEQHGYSAGYERAVWDVSLSLLEVAEDLIRRRGLSGSQAADLRRVVWAVREDLHGRRRAAPEFVEGGLGI